MTRFGGFGFRSRPVLLLLLAALGGRLAYVLLLHPTPAGQNLLIDSAFYDERASAIAAGKGFGPGPYFMNPGYPYLLAVLYALGARGPLSIGIVQSLTGTGATLGIGLLARRWFSDPRVGLAAMGIAALYAPFWFYDGAILTASPILAGSVLLLLLLERLRDRPGARLASAAGAVAALVALMRPTVLLFVAPLPWLLAAGHSSADGEAVARPASSPGVNPAPGLRRAGFWVIAVTCLGILPATVRNLVVSGEPVLLTTGVGMNFYTGHHPGATGVYAGAPFVSSYEPVFERADFQREAERRSGRRLTASEASHFWLMEGLRSIGSTPWATLRRELAKLALAFHHVESQNNLSFDFVRDQVPLLRFNPLDFRLIGPLGLAGLALLGRRGGDRAILGLGFAAAHLAAMLIFFVSSEYRLPLLVLLIPAAGAFLIAVVDRLRGGPALPRAAVWLLVLGLVAANRETELTHRLSSRRVDYLNFATLAEARGDLPQALALLDRALAYDPAFIPALRRQASLARRVGLSELATRTEAKIAALPAAESGTTEDGGSGATEGGESDIARGGESHPGEIDRAVGLYRTGRYDEALAAFTNLARGQAGDDPRLLNNIGLCLYKLGRLSEAESALRRAHARDPGYTRALSNLGLVLEGAGRSKEAEAIWREVLSREPDNALARRQLAR